MQDDSRRIRWAVLLQPRWILLGFVILLAVLRGLAELIPTRIEIGPDTTVLDGPRHPDGTIDYASAIDEEWSKGIQPEENAMVDLIHAFGTDGSISAGIRTDYLERLGVSTADDAEDVYIDFSGFLEQSGFEPGTDAFIEHSKSLEEVHSRPWSDKEFGLVAEWLQRNEGPMRHIETASTKPSFYAPVIPTLTNEGSDEWELPEIGMF